MLVNIGKNIMICDSADDYSLIKPVQHKYPVIIIKDKVRGLTVINDTSLSLHNGYIVEKMLIIFDEIKNADIRIRKTLTENIELIISCGLETSAEEYLNNINIMSKEKLQDVLKAAKNTAKDSYPEFYSNLSTDDYIRDKYNNFDKDFTLHISPILKDPSADKAKRETQITSDDITDLKIALGLCNDTGDFINNL